MLPIPNSGPSCPFLPPLHPASLDPPCASTSRPPARLNLSTTHPTPPTQPRPHPVLRRAAAVRIGAGRPRLVKGAAQGEGSPEQLYCAEFAPFVPCKFVLSESFCSELSVCQALGCMHVGRWGAAAGGCTVRAGQSRLPTASAACSCPCPCLASPLLPHALPPFPPARRYGSCRAAGTCCCASGYGWITSWCACKR